MCSPVNCTDQELCIFLAALEAGYTATCCLDIDQSAPLKSMSIANRSYRKGKKTISFHGFQFSMMLNHLTENFGAARLTSLPEDSPVQIFPLQEKALALMEKKAGYGQKWQELSVKYDPNLCLWKTHLQLWEEDLSESLVTLPKSGMTVSGTVFQRVKSEHPTKEKDYFSLPTPTATDANGRTYHYSRGDKTRLVLSLVGIAKLLPTPAATDWKGQYTWETVKKRMSKSEGVRLSEELCRRVGKAIIPNPEFWEWMMAWPIGSSGLKPVEMVKFHAWLRQHSLN